MVEEVADMVTAVDPVPSLDHEAARGQGQKPVHLEAHRGLARDRGQCLVLEVARDLGRLMKAHARHLLDITIDEIIDVKRRTGRFFDSNKLFGKK